MPNNFVEQETDIADVQVNIGSIEAGTNDPFLDLSELDGVFDDYWIVQRYEKDKQRWMMPVTSPDGFDGDSVAFVQLAGETILWIVDWTGEKSGNAPSVPDPNLDDENWVLLDEHIEPAMLLKRPSGEIVYRISGTYTYGCKNPSQAKMHYGRPPWMSKKVGCEVATSQFKRGIIVCGNESSDSSQADNPEESGSFPPDE